jgi:TRAP-type mannitol/chloroaromatic compound transport system permease small subunit
MQGIITKVDRVIGKICLSMSDLGTYLAFGMMLLIVADVLGRVIFNSPITAAVELIKASVPALTFLMLPWATHKMRHIRTTLIYGRLSWKFKVYVDLLAYLMGFMLMVLIFSACMPNVISSFINGEFEGDGALISIPTFPSWLIIALGSLLTSWEMGRSLVLSVIYPAKRNIDIKLD